MDRFVIPRLEKLAFEVSYKELLSNLLLCREHRPEERQVELVAFSSLISACSFLKSENVITFVRNRLNRYLLGFMNDKMRNKYLEKFYQNYNLFNDNIIDIWVFLECVLDDSVQELETHVAFPGTEPNPKLIPTIENRASFLTNLKLNFKSMKETTTVEKTNQLITSLSSLECLTSLSLHHLPELHRSVLKFVGSSCPLLTHLSITGFRIMPLDILLIMLGDLAETLFPQYGEKKPWTEDDALRLLQVPPQLLTPLCFTLKHLQLEDVDWDTNATYSCWSIVTFALRHLPSLEKMDGMSTSFGVQSFISWNTLAEAMRSEGINGEQQQNRLDQILLAESLEPTLDAELEKQLTTEFEATCNHIITSRLELTDEEKTFFSRPTFSGTLALTKLDCVSLRHAFRLPTIGKLCPHLKEVLFRELWPDWQPDQDTSDEELEESFREWPELETITLSTMTPRFIKAVLKAFGPKLKSLAFESCNNISLADLIPCTNLETLKFLKSSSIASHEEGEQNSGITAESFLPELVSLESSICLGPFAAQLFEHKSKLTSVSLNCCHIGAKGYPVSDWNSLPKMWPHLETLHIRRCIELTLPMISNIVSQLSKLKVLSLPETITQSDLAMAAGILDDFTNRLAPINLSFVKGLFGKVCPLLGKVDWVVNYDGEEFSDDEEGAGGWGGGNFAVFGFHDHFDDALHDVDVEDFFDYENDDDYDDYESYGFDDDEDDFP